MAAKKTARVDVYMPAKTAGFIDTVARMGYLGDTREEVIVHFVKQFVFETWMKAIANTSGGPVDSALASARDDAREVKSPKPHHAKGGKSRARVLTPERRKIIAKKAAGARWKAKTK